MKIIKKFVLLIVMLVLISGCDNTSSIHHIEMSIKDKGIIKIELDEKYAPITVKNFIKLANDNFYDGLTFHRIINGFMIQGGSPTGDSNGGLSEKIKGEFLANGVENTLKHDRGVISMARASDYNSASCQFFIMHEKNESLDGLYAAFGRVTEGMEIVDDIATNTKVEDSNGTVLKENQPIIEYIKVID